MTKLSLKMTTELEGLADPQDARAKAPYYGVVPGGYGEGDRLLGVRMPVVRSLARRYRDETSLRDVRALLSSPWHEVRQLGAVLLVELYRRGDDELRQKCVDLLLGKAERFDNWDLVDVCAPHTLGVHLVPRRSQRPLLDDLVAADLVWRRRIGMVSTQALIRNNEFEDTLRLAVALLRDPHPLMHKATGWMLREVGNRDRKVLDAFLNKYATRLPRTALRYAIEKHAPAERRRYLAMAPV